MKKIKLFIISVLLVPLTIFGQKTSTEIAKTGIKSTVSVVALDNMSQPLGFGSGFIIDDEQIVTNVHVIEGSNSAYVLIEGQEKKYTVNGYVAIDKVNDLVILKVTGLYGSKLFFETEKNPEIGEKIYAVGNPKGLNGTFSEGIISGIRDVATNQVLQITAPISPGSSGGPVLNTSGQVIGIAFGGYSDGQNLNFAIPVKYLIALKTKISGVTALSTVKPQQKTASAKDVNSNIKEGVVVRNIGFRERCPFENLSFSIKNNLPHTVSDITILFLVYDATGTVVDYAEEKYFERKYKKDYGINPFLAKSFPDCSGSNNDSSAGTSPKLILKAGYKVRARVLDFKIIEE